MRAPRLYALVAMSVLAAGCITVLPKAPPVQLYRFGTPAEDAPKPGQTRIVGIGGAARGVVLSTLSLPRAAMGDKLLTIMGDQAAYIAGARWTGPAVILFQEDVEAAFAAHAAQTVLIARDQLGAASALLSLNVTRFETRYPPDGGPPTVVVSVSATLTRPDGSALAARAFTVEQAASADRVSAIVAAYDRAADMALSQVVAWTEATAPSLGRAP